MRQQPKRPNNKQRPHAWKPDARDWLEQEIVARVLADGRHYDGDRAWANALMAEYTRYGVMPLWAGGKLRTQKMRDNNARMVAAMADTVRTRVQDGVSVEEIAEQAGVRPAVVNSLVHDGRIKDNPLLCLVRWAREREEVAA